MRNDEWRSKEDMKLNHMVKQKETECVGSDPKNSYGKKSVKWNLQVLVELFSKTVWKRYLVAELEIMGPKYLEEFEILQFEKLERS